MPSIFQLLQTAGDVPGFGQDLELEEAPLFERDPVLRKLLEVDALDRRTASILVQRDNARIQRERDEARLLELKRALGEAPPHDRSVIATLGGIPVGFQFGTAAGIENPIGRFLVDVLVDPLNFVGGIGALNKIGRAARALTKGEQVLSAGKLADTISDGALALSKGVIDPKYADDISDAAKAFDFVRMEKLVKQARKTKFSPADLKKLDQVDPDGFLSGIVKDFFKGKRKATKDVESVFDLTRRGVDQIEPLKARRIDQIIAGQRDILTLGIPFTRMETGIRASHLLSSLRSADAVKKAAKSVVGSLKEAAEVTELAGGAAARVGVSVGAKADLNDASTLFKFIDTEISGLDHSLGTIDGDLAQSGLDIGGIAGRRSNAVDQSNLVIEESIRRILGHDEHQLELVTKAIEHVDDLSDTEAITKLLPDAIKGEKEVSEHVPALIDRVRDFYNVYRKRASQSGALAKDMGRIEEDAFSHYVTHMFEFESEDARRAFIEFADKRQTARFKRAEQLRKFPKRTRFRSRFAFERTFDTFDDAEAWLATEAGKKSGLKVKTKRIDLIVGGYGRSMGQSIIRNQTLRAWEAGRAPGTSLPLAFGPPNRQKMLGRLREAAERAFREGEYGKISNEVFKDWHFHKSILQDAKTLYERDWIALKRGEAGFTPKVITAFDRMNSMLKAFLFNMNPFFHGGSLGYSAAAALPLRTALRSIRDVGEALKITKLGVDEAAVTDHVFRMLTQTFTVPGVKGVDASDMLSLFRQSGIKVRPEHLDETFNVLDETLTSIQRVIPLPKGFDILGAIKQWNVISDRALWRVTLPTFQITAWRHIMHTEMLNYQKKFGSSAPIPRHVLEEMSHNAGKATDKMFGTLAAENFLLTPNAHRALRHAFLAPNWTFANFFMGLDMFLNMPGVRHLLGNRFTRDQFANDMAFRWSLAYNFRALLYGSILANMLNFGFTSIKDGKGRFLWENDKASFDKATGVKSRIELPYVDHKGRRQFMDIFKQFAEPLKLFNDPGDFIKGKIGTIPRFVQTAVFGQDSFGNTIGGTTNGPYEQILLRSYEVVGQFSPIVVQGAVQAAAGQRHPFSAIFPSFTGLSIRSEPSQDVRRRQQIAEILNRQPSLGAR